MSLVSPSFFVVGAPKSGTTSLYGYLRSHPDVYLPAQKELHFFSSSQLLHNASGPGDKDALMSICKTKDEYLSHYDGCKDCSVAGDISPSYLFYSEVADSIKSFSSNAKIIIMLRNPAEKSYSQYSHLLRSGREVCSFSDGLLAEKERLENGWNDMWYYTEGSKYYEKVKKYFEVFGANNVKVIIFEDFIKNTDASVKDICRFIGVSDKINFSTGDVHNKGTGAQRFGAVGKYIINNNVLRYLLDCGLPSSYSAKIKNLGKKIFYKSKGDVSDSEKNKIMNLLSEDIADLEDLIGFPTGWK
jgi:hypothetical protein